MAGTAIRSGPLESLNLRMGCGQIEDEDEDEDEYDRYFAWSEARQLIDHHDRANWNLDEEFARGLGRQANASM